MFSRRPDPENAVLDEIIKPSFPSSSLRTFARRSGGRVRRRQWTSSWTIPGPSGCGIDVDRNSIPEIARAALSPDVEQQPLERRASAGRHLHRERFLDRVLDRRVLEMVRQTLASRPRLALVLNVRRNARPRPISVKQDQRAEPDAQRIFVQGRHIVFMPYQPSDQFDPLLSVHIARGLRRFHLWIMSTRLDRDAARCTIRMFRWLGSQAQARGEVRT